MKLKIYFDMDDVANELCRYLMERYNKDYNDHLHWLKNSRQMIWENPHFKADKEYIFKVMFEEGTFFNPPPSEGFVECVNRLMEEGYEVKFLTYPQWSSEFCMNEKIRWIQTYLPSFPLDNVVFAKHKGDLAGEGRVLLDDSPNNLRLWEENGGIGVSFAKIQYSKEWQGEKVESFQEFYDLIKELESRISSFDE